MRTSDHSSSNNHIGVGYKKVCGISGGSTPSLDPIVSCSYGESTKIPSKNRAYVQTGLSNGLFEDLDFLLVGLGEKGVNCGVIFASHICQNLDCLKVHYAKQGCERKACPECYRKWMVEERDRITARILSKEAIKKNKGKRLVEITLSPDPKKVPVNRYEFDRVIREGYGYIKKKGVKGGCAIIHPFRATKEAKRLSRDSKEKTWNWIRRQENPWRYFYYSPHLHLLAYTNHLSKPKRGEDWIYKTKTNENGNVIDFLRKAKRGQALRKMIGYFLSHTATLENDEGGFHSIRWFGTCSYNKFGTTGEEREVMEREERVDLRCKICGDELISFWKWVRMSYGDVYWDVVRGRVKEPRYWDEVMSAVGKEDPPPDAEKYVI